MASTLPLQPSYSLFLARQNGNRRTRRGVLAGRRYYVKAAATGGPGNRQRAPPGVDTRIHWENHDEGWIGGSNSATSKDAEEEDQKNLLGEKFSDMLNDSSDSHYQNVLRSIGGSRPRKIKAAYRRLSKE